MPLSTALRALPSLVAAVVSGAAAADAQPLLRVERTHDWTLRLRAQINGVRHRDFLGPNISPPLFETRFALEDATLVFPLLERSAFFEAEPDSLTFKAFVDGRPRRVEFDTLDGPFEGESQGLWRFGAFEGSQLTLQIERAVTTKEVRLDEAQAQRIAWAAPEEHPPQAQRALATEPFIEPQDEAVQALLQRITLGRARSVPPVLFAKAVAGELVAGFALRDDQALFNELGGLEGLHIHGAAWAARRMEGTVFDLAALTCALYRAAGLPARMVVGYDVLRTQGRRSGVVGLSYPCGQEGAGATGAPVLWAWVEFFLLTDPREGAGLWIPVDVAKQRLESSTPPPIDQPWTFFGQSPCSIGMIPLALHPLAARGADRPAVASIWGWRPAAGAPPVLQQLTLDAFTAPVVGR